MLMKRIFLTLIVAVSATYLFANAPKQNESADKVVRTLSRNFSNEYSMNGFVSKMKAFKTVRSESGYIDFKAAVGFIGLEQRRSKSHFPAPQFAIIDKYASYPYHSNGTEILKEENIVGSFPLGYRNEFAVWELRNIGDILDFSPLNSTYSQQFIYTYDERESNRINFKSDNNTYNLSRLPVVANGYIIYDPDNMRVKKIVFNDYSSYRYVKAIQKKAYIPTITLDFISHNDMLVLSSISFKRVWNIENVDRSYDIYPPNRRNPVENGVTDYFLMIIDTPIDTWGDFMQKNSNLSNIRTSDKRVPWWIMSFECAPYSPERWTYSYFASFSSDEIPVKEIFSDLAKEVEVAKQVERFIDYTPHIHDYVILRDRYGLNRDFYDYQSFLRFYKSVYPIFNELY